MLIPEYLQEISETIKKTKNTVTIKLKCNCGGSDFKVYKSVEQDIVDIEHGFKEIIRDNGELYLVKRNFFGKIIKRIKCDNMFCEKPRKIIKVKCEKCGIEHIIFDNYKHGYDAIINKYEGNAANSNDLVEFKLCYSHPMEVFLKIYQDILYDDFKEEFHDLDFNTYLYSFSNIDIYGVASKNKKINIYSEETA